MTVDTRTRTKVPNRLTLLLAAGLLMDDGVMPDDVAKERAEAVRTGQPVGGRRNVGDMVRQALRPLIDDGAVIRVDGTWYAPNLADLAAWIADGFQTREDAGCLDNPTVPIPGQRRAVA